MVEYHFDASRYEPWTENETARNYALWLWLHYLSEDEDMGLALACELAPFDSEVYVALREWALSKEISTLPESVQAALARALLRPKPRKSKNTRDTRLAAIAVRLVERYGVTLTSNEATDNRESAATILESLPDTPSARTIANILSRKLGRSS